MNRYGSPYDDVELKAHVCGGDGAPSMAWGFWASYHIYNCKWDNGELKEGDNNDVCDSASVSVDDIQGYAW